MTEHSLGALHISLRSINTILLFRRRAPYNLYTTRATSRLIQTRLHPTANWHHGPLLREDICCGSFAEAHRAQYNLAQMVSLHCLCLVVRFQRHGQYDHVYAMQSSDGVVGDGTSSKML